MEPLLVTVAHQETARKASQLMLWAGPSGYPTPNFEPTDPLVCHTLKLRPSLWAVVFDTMQRLGEPYSWIQDDPTAATPDEVAAEINKATDDMVFAGCIMIGQVMMLATDAPEWTLLCDGTSYDREDYPELYAVLDPAFIVDADHFTVPDLLDRFAFLGTSVGDTGGESSHVLTTGEIPAHQHTEVTTGITGLFVAPGEVPAIIAPGADLTGSTGGGNAHNNMPPYLTLLPVIVARYPSA